MNFDYGNVKQPNEISLTKFTPIFDSIIKEKCHLNETAEVKGKYPKIVFLIILNEICERYLFYLFLCSIFIHQFYFILAFLIMELELFYTYF